LRVARARACSTEHLPHGSRREREELGPVLPLEAFLPPLAAGDACVGLVHQGGGLERVIAPLAPHMGARDAAQLGMQERKQLTQGAIAVVARASEQGADSGRLIACHGEPMMA